jgi:putative ABC transport system substrate-binding protein
VSYFVGLDVSLDETAICIIDDAGELLKEGDYAEAGGLMSYGVERTALFHRAADLVARILDGVKPADLPIEQADRFQLVVNIKTANTLGLTFPPSILARADEVIE